jgi:hypothetical protein
VAVDGDDGVLFDAKLAARGLNDCKHVGILRFKELSRITLGRRIGQMANRQIGE